MLKRPLGTMITYGYPEIALEDELDLAIWIGHRSWKSFPSGAACPIPPWSAGERPIADCRSTVRTAVGAGERSGPGKSTWGPSTQRPIANRWTISRRAWIGWRRQGASTWWFIRVACRCRRKCQSAGRRSTAGLCELAEHARATGMIICVENMPPGVYPGSRMAGLAEILRELDHPQLALALDTGHANLTASAAEETLAAGCLLATTHVHDNNGRQDSHEPPGHGTVDWAGWGRALDQIGYDGPILLECIRFLRHDRSSYRPEVLAALVGGSPRVLTAFLTGCAEDAGSVGRDRPARAVPWRRWHPRDADTIASSVHDGDGRRACDCAGSCRGKAVGCGRYPSAKRGEEQQRRIPAREGARICPPG